MAQAAFGSADFKVFDVKGFQPRMSQIRMRSRPQLERSTAILRDWGVSTGVMWARARRPYFFVDGAGPKIIGKHHPVADKHLNVDDDAVGNEDV